jgi:hypothetical protein
MPSRLAMILSALLISLLLALGGALKWGLSQSRAATLAQGRVDALTIEVNVLDERLRALPAELQRQRTARAPAEKALDEVPDWRDSAVPKPVADGLCARLRCAPVHPVPTPHR